METQKVVELASRQQRDVILSLLAELGYSTFEPYFLWRLKKASGFTRIRTRNEAETAIGTLEEIKADRAGSAVAKAPESGGQGKAA